MADVSEGRQQLLSVGFVHVGRWSIQGDLLTPEFAEVPAAQNILYAFAVGSQVTYVGKTTRGLKKRMYNYQMPGPSQRTNIRNHLLIRELLAAGQSVDILAWWDRQPQHLGPFPINLAAGLEDGIVRVLRPEWNGMGEGRRLG